MEQHLDQITASRPAYVKPFNGVSNVEQARAKRPANFKIENVSDTYAIVEIYDEIGGWGIWASELVPALRRIDAKGRTIEVRINSGGGDVFEGLTIANALKFMDAEIIVVIYGLAASIASVIAIAGDEVRMPANAMMMIHRPHMILWGEAEDLRKGADLLDVIEQQLINTYADRAQQTPRDTIAAMVAEETWLTAADCVAIGLADTVIADARMAACASRSIEAKAAPAEAIALLAGTDTTEPTEEAAVPETAIEEVPAASAEEPAVEASAEAQAGKAPAVEATEQDPAAVAENASAEVTEETPAVSIEASVSVPGASLRIPVRAVIENGQIIGLEFGDAVATEEPAAVAEAVVEDAAEELTEAVVETTPGAAAAEDGYPVQDAPTAERTEEAIAIRAACSVLDASDKADGFIAAGMNFEQVRKALWDHRVAAATQNDIVTQGSSLLAENPAGTPQAQLSEGPSALKRAYQARKGRKS